MEILKQKVTKSILVILLILIMSFNIFQPITIAAEGTGGRLFAPIMNFVATIPDLGINFLQHFLWDRSRIMVSNKEVVLSEYTLRIEDIREYTNLNIYIRTSNNIFK